MNFAIYLIVMVTENEKQTAAAFGVLPADTAWIETHVAQTLFRQYRITLPGTFATSLLALAVFWPVAPGETLMAWGAFYTLFLMLRYLLCDRLSQALRVQLTPRQSIRLFTLLSVVSGGFWGCLALVLIPLLPIEYGVILILFAAGLSASAASSYVVALGAVYGFMLPFLLSIVWACLSLGGGIHLSMAAMTVLYTGVLMVTSRQMNASVTESFGHQARNERLMADLENLNRDLMREISLREQAEASLKQHLESVETAKKEAEADSRSKSAFLAVMSHEIRTPLNVIAMAARKLTHMMPDPRQARYGEMILTSGESLLHLINDILDHESIEAGRIRLEALAFNLKLLLEKILNQYRDRADKKNIQLAFRYKSGTPEMITADPYRIRQIMVNLLDNAVKFTLSGRITVSVSCAGKRRWRITVSDTGEGIPEERIQKIFAPFEQADASTTRRHGGSGLGLSICKKLLTLMGGNIRAKSQPGKGSVFSFVLPELKKKQALIPLGPNRKSSAGCLGRSLHILLADDDEMSCFLIREFLEEFGHWVQEAANGAQAVAAVEKGGIDLVVMDVNMPVMDGISAMVRIREKEAGCTGRLPIIALTALAFSMDRDRCLTAGADAFVTKPVVPEKLASVINHLTARPPPYRPCNRIGTGCRQTRGGCSYGPAFFKKRARYGEPAPGCV